MSYLASDLLGSATVALDGSGIPIASQLYAPYGGVRYSNGTMPTDYGFTGQRADSATGLDYIGASLDGMYSYDARYYDPYLSQFVSASGPTGSSTNTDEYTENKPVTEGITGDDSDWKDVIVTVMVVGGLIFGFLRLYIPNLWRWNDPGGTYNNTVGSNRNGTGTEEEDQTLGNGKPINGKKRKGDDDNNSGIPKGPPPSSIPARGQVGQSQTAARNPAINQGRMGGYRNQRNPFQVVVENERMNTYDAQQNAWLSAKYKSASDPSWIQIAWYAFQQTPDGQALDQLGQWVGSWRFDPAPAQPVCAEFASAGCIDPNNPFKGGKDDGKGDDIPIRPGQEEIPFEP